ncbi:Bug family tripartite tricarboxylate transporter substrate binding protein [Candidimonas nitroreducens]|uniref:ABC transporter substrate-binding protein n=1 Tax=Candidimonas nitroreducens TaxID=683354 RepID=A0A225MMW2_9BURK|nr:tripartite tricarboxylate transporter substrate binding protein [Candidimonas nitroreducens]OWT60109.1 ABC transporter substrate-binding protein [Candidimonas nitroreducens]
MATTKISTRRREILGWGAALATGLIARPFTSLAQSSAPLHVILPLSAGSGVDIIVRSAQNALGTAFGQPVVIENRPGAGGITGTAALVRSKPDGLTVGVVSNNHCVNPSVFKNLPYDSLADITPISVIGGSPFVFVVNPKKVSVRTAKELQAYLRAKPGSLRYGSSGNGTIIQLAAEMFLQGADVKAQHIPYRGTGPMIADILSGQVEMGVAALAVVQGYLKNGMLHAIGVMGKQRVRSMPDIPTFIEQGFPTVDVAGWFAVIGPKGIPADQVQRLHDGFVKGFTDPQVKAGFDKRDDFLVLDTPAQASAFFSSEEKRYAQLVKRAGIHVN